MKKIIAATLTILLLSQITSCTKETTTTSTETYHVPGLWIGQYSTSGTSGSYYSSYVFYPDGTLVQKNIGTPPAQTVIYATGNWSLADSTLTCNTTTLNYTSIVSQNLKFTYSNTGILSNGTWKNTTADNGIFYTGTFSTMKRVN